jgi:hypothetical protein
MPQRMKGRALAQVLSAELALLADEMDGLEFLESLLGDVNLWEY